MNNKYDAAQVASKLQTLLKERRIKTSIDGDIFFPHDDAEVQFYGNMMEQLGVNFDFDNRRFLPRDPDAELETTEEVVPTPLEFESMRAKPTWCNLCNKECGLEQHFEPKTPEEKQRRLKAFREPIAVVPRYGWALRREKDGTTYIPRYMVTY